MAWLGARYYDPAAGQFLSPDPLGFAGGPNLHAFAHGDPVNFFDPDGRLGRGVWNGGKDLVTGAGQLLYNLGGTIGYGWTAMFDYETAESVYGQERHRFLGAARGAGQALYDVGGGIGYTLTRDEEMYGGQLDRLYGVANGLSGGEDNPAAYRLGYTGTQIATAFLGGEFLAGRAGEAALLGERALAAAEALEASRILRLPKTNPLLTGTTTLGYTTRSGEVLLQPGMPRVLQAAILRHESVHAFLSARTGPFLSFRQNLAQFGYDHSAFLQGTEEMLAEAYAQGSLRAGLQHAFSGAYSTPYYTVTPLSYTLEAGTIGASVYGVGWSLHRLIDRP